MDWSVSSAWPLHLVSGATWARLNIKQDDGIGLCCNFHQNSSRPDDAFSSITRTDHLGIRVALTIVRRGANYLSAPGTMRHKTGRYYLSRSVARCSAGFTFAEGFWV
jgi:hypothetical protein